MIVKEYVITVNNKKYIFKLEDRILKYCPNKNDSESTTTREEIKEIVIPNIIIVTRKNGVPLFALEPDRNDINQFEIVTAQQMYNDKKIQWFEPLANNYRKLIWVNEKTLVPNSDVFDAYKHFTWNQIIQFSLIDRMSVSYAGGLSGDWKQVSMGAEGYLIVTVNGRPFWADAIGQLPFTIDTMRKYIMKFNGDYEKAISETIITGIKHGDGGVFFPKEDKTNNYDNYMILRGCLWSKSKFTYVTRGREKHELIENKENFENILDSEIKKEVRDKYAQWNY